VASFGMHSERKRHRWRAGRSVITGQVTLRPGGQAPGAGRQQGPAAQQVGMAGSQAPGLPGWGGR
jgi:hypothetical protein